MHNVYIYIYIHIYIYTHMIIHASYALTHSCTHWHTCSRWIHQSNVSSRPHSPVILSNQLCTCTCHDMHMTLADWAKQQCQHMPTIHIHIIHFLWLSQRLSQVRSGSIKNSVKVSIGFIVSCSSCILSRQLPATLLDSWGKIYGKLISHTILPHESYMGYGTWIYHINISTWFTLESKHEAPLLGHGVSQVCLLQNGSRVQEIQLVADVWSRWINEKWGDIYIYIYI